MATKVAVRVKFKTELLALIPEMRAFAYSLSGNPHRADDLVQETLVKAWAHHSSYKEGTNMRAWLFTILRNEFYSQLRKTRREVEDADGAYSEKLFTPPGQESHIKMDELKVALTKLPDDQREAIVLVGASGLSYEEAAEICGTAVGTMKSRVSRARSRLTALLGEEALT